MKARCLQRMLIGLGLTMVLATPWASAADRYVAPNGTGGGTSWTDTHSNLIEMVALAGDNDTVYVTNNAKYYLTNQIVVKYAITVRSWGPGGILDPTNTILDGNYPITTNRHFTLSNYWATLAGFTLSNGWGSANTNGLGNTGASGGAISIYYGTVTNCIITRNSVFSADPSYSQAGGGGIFMGMDNAKSGGVWNCTISGNSVGPKNCGGGIMVNNGSWRIVNCTISGNTAPSAGGYEGGGIYANPASGGLLVISNCWVVSNSAGYAGGIRTAFTECHNSFIMGNTVTVKAGGIRVNNNSVIRNCLISQNSAATGGGISGNNSHSIQSCTIVSNVSSSDTGGGFDFSGSAGFPVIENTIIWGNRSGGSGIYSNWYVWRTNPSTTWVTFTNCCTAPDIYSNNPGPSVYGVLASGVNTVTNDPRYVSATDFRLQLDSPCIDAGVNRYWMEGALDLYGYRRIDIFRKTVDIGAYEYLSKGTMFSGH
ncbi:MAG: right-handed parallel beta-helix repeat-containing protein [Kiritimatiellaeota bacterium]|nr:right-handed parallel beta-helix repeat-containing protein [Kiritimatiellota bacterium]